MTPSFAKGASPPCSGHPTVITGAGGDLGRELAVRLSRQGARVALIDHDGGRLGATFEACRQSSQRVTAWTVDVSDFGDVSQVAEQIRVLQGPTHAVYNLAGVIHAGLLVDSEPADLERIVRVDLLGTMSCAHAFLPDLLQSGHGKLVNVSSALGLIAVPGYTAYSAAKFGVRGFTEALQQEVDPSKVTVSAVYPGGVRTGIMRRATYAASADRYLVQDMFDRSVARTSTSKAVTQMIEGVDRGRRRIVIGADARTVDLLARVAGNGYQRFTRKMGMRHPS